MNEILYVCLSVTLDVRAYANGKIENFIIRTYAFLKK